jgi:hypothetical protein
VVQPPDAENGMSGGVGGVTGAIRSPRPDLVANFRPQGGRTFLSAFLLRASLFAAQEIHQQNVIEVGIAEVFDKPDFVFPLFETKRDHAFGIRFLFRGPARATLFQTPEITREARDRAY